MRHEAGIIVGKGNGRLQVIATPIGNLADLSARAREALLSADVIAAEDTRHTRVLLSALGIAKPLVSLHEHNESQRTPELLARLAAGETIALVSDAGTPLLSDPGLELVQRAAHAGFEVHAIPGPSAITSALAVAGLPTGRFCFEGFLPSRERERRRRTAVTAHRGAARAGAAARQSRGDRRAADRGHPRRGVRAPEARWHRAGLERRRGALGPVEPSNRGDPRFDFGARLRIV